MHRPVAAPFQGSLPTGDVEEVKLVRLLDILFGGLALLLAGGVWVGAYALTTSPDLPSVLTASCLVLLAPALVGLWLVRQAEHAPRLVLTRIYDEVFRRLAQTGPLAAPQATDEALHRGLAGVLGDLAVLSQRLNAGRARDRARAAESFRLLQAGRDEAGSLASRMTEDAAALADVAVSVDCAGARLAGELAAVRQSFDVSDEAMARATAAVAGVAASVRATTDSVTQMTLQASRLAQVGHDTQVWTADLDDRTVRLQLALDQVGERLERARALARSAESAQAGQAAGSTGRDAVELQAIASTTQTALDACLALLQDLAGETVQANRRVAAISELVRSNHEIGEVVVHAVQQQGEDIGRVLQHLYEARTGFATLKAGVNAVARIGTEHGEAADILRQVAQRLPSHAETMASILRAIPDFKPPTPI